VFFAFIGFDVVATTAEETRKPQRDMPIGILGSLAICTVLYVVVSMVLTGMVKYTELNTAAPWPTPSRRSATTGSPAWCRWERWPG
jgi:APA family basic amino acid/polyamine antiporter